MQRRTFLASLGALGLPVLAGGCGHPASPLRVASHVWPGYEFMFLARREGWISGQDTVLVETGSATESTQLLATDKADAAALTLDEMLGARARGLPLMAVLIFDISLGADVLLARPGIESLAQLKGRRIGHEPSAVGALMLHKALEAAALRIDEVQVVDVTFDQHEKAWRAGQVDALITFEPLASLLHREGAPRLFDSSRIPDTIFDVLAVMPAAAERNPDALRRLIAAHFQGQRNFRKNPNDAAYRMAERMHLPAKEVLAAFGGLELPDVYRNRKLLRGENAPLVNVARELAAFLSGAGIMQRPLTDFSQLASTEYLPTEDIR
jgi:NitT/TauT family transport system substrate-binding protein